MKINFSLKIIEILISKGNSPFPFEPMLYLGKGKEKRSLSYLGIILELIYIFENNINIILVIYI